MERGFLVKSGVAGLGNMGGVGEFDGYNGWVGGLIVFSRIPTLRSLGISNIQCINVLLLLITESNMQRIPSLQQLLALYKISYKPSITNRFNPSNHPYNSPPSTSTTSPTLIVLPPAPGSTHICPPKNTFPSNLLVLASVTKGSSSFTPVP